MKAKKKFVEFPTDGAAYEMIYNQKEPLTMFDGYLFAYKMGDLSFRSIKLQSRANGT